MANYEKMYLTLFRAQTQAILNLQGVVAALQAAQQETEEIFFDTEADELRRLRSKAGEDGPNGPAGPEKP